MEPRRIETSVLARFDARELHHFGPLLRFLGDELAEFGGRAREHNAAQVGKSPHQLRISEADVDFLVEQFDDLGGRALGARKPTLPAASRSFRILG